VIEAVNKAMLELHRALGVRTMFVSGAHVQRSQKRACDLINHLLEHLPSIDVLLLDDRVIFDNLTLPASANLLTGLFGILHQHGVDRITFRRGLQVKDIATLLDQLADRKSQPSQKLQPTDNIAFGFLQCSDDTDSSESPSKPQTVDGEQIAASVDNLWQDTNESEPPDPELLASTAGSIVAMVSVSDTAMVSLAAIKKHDEYTFVHSSNVAILSTLLGEALGFDSTTVHDICIAGLLHDTGKRHIPSELLNKTGALTKEEFKLLQTHPVHGARLLLGAPGIPDLAPIAAYEHHVYADGTGYPQLPQPGQLNLASRIVQLADIFDALGTHRPYRQALPLPEITEIMQRDAGVLLDKDLLDLFLEQVAPRCTPEPVPPQDMCIASTPLETGM